VRVQLGFASAGVFQLDVQVERLLLKDRFQKKVGCARPRRAQESRPKMGCRLRQIRVTPSPAADAAERGRVDLFSGGKTLQAHVQILDVVGLELTIRSAVIMTILPEVNSMERGGQRWRQIGSPNGERKGRCSYAGFKQHGLMRMGISHSTFHNLLALVKPPLAVQQIKERRSG
jgi:hypothetical protein